jgi:hypothetical protein
MSSVLQLIINLLAIAAIMMQARKVVLKSLKYGRLGHYRDRLWVRYMQWKIPKWQQTLAKNDLFLDISHKLSGQGDDMSDWKRRRSVHIPFDTLDFSASPTEKPRDMYANWAQMQMQIKSLDSEINIRHDAVICPHCAMMDDKSACELCQRMLAAFEEDTKLARADVQDFISPTNGKKSPLFWQ